MTSDATANPRGGGAGRGWGVLLLFPVLASLSCGGGDSAGTPVTPSAPRPPRQLIGMEIFAEQTSIRIGQMLGPLIVYGEYDDGTSGTLNVTWTSSDPSVAEVAEDGSVTGNGVGRASVTATFEAFTASIDLEVDEANVRTTRNQPDDIAGPQIHVIYALPSDGEDLSFDRYGDIARSFEQIQGWLMDDIGYRLRLDTHDGELDVSFLRLSATDQEIRGAGVFDVVDVIGTAIAAQVGHDADKLYAVYYYGQSAFGGLANFGERLAITMVDPTSPNLYAPGRYPGGVGGWEAIMVHELFHVFGAVPTCAPNEGQGFHVTDSTRDLMFAGIVDDPTEAVGSVAIDVGRDDYFQHGRSDCLDIADSRFWERVGPARAASGVAGSRGAPLLPHDPPFRCGLH